MNKMFIVRGLPGSGKNTLADCFGTKVVSADDYFVDSNGQYNFDATKLKAAHRYCYGKVKSIVDVEEDVAVANTFTQLWEMEPYLELAKERGYMVFTLVVENRHGGVNVHDVPELNIARMRNRFQVEL